MNLRRATVLFVLIGALVPDVPALAAFQTCGTNDTGVCGCCCGEACPSNNPSESGLTGACCELRIPSREAETVPPVSMRLAEAAVALTQIATPLDPGPSALPVSHEADAVAPDTGPPRFELFCSYLI